jgi:hypothetical protein
MSQAPDILLHLTLDQRVHQFRVLRSLPAFETNGEGKVARAEATVVERKLMDTQPLGLLRTAAGNKIDHGPTRIAPGSAPIAAADLAACVASGAHGFI